MEAALEDLSDILLAFEAHERERKSRKAPVPLGAVERRFAR